MDALSIKRLPAWATKGFIYHLDDTSYIYNNESPEIYNKFYVSVHPNMDNDRLNMLLEYMVQRLPEPVNNWNYLRRTINEKAISKNSTLNKIASKFPNWDRSPACNPHRKYTLYDSTSILWDNENHMMNKFYITTCWQMNEDRLTDLLRLLEQNIKTETPVDKRVIITKTPHNIDDLNESIKNLTDMCKKQSDIIDQLKSDMLSIKANTTVCDSPTNVVENTLAMYQKFPGLSIKTVQNGKTLVEVVDGVIVINI